MLMKEIIDQIDDVILESEIDVLQAMSDVYDKAQIILENSDTTDGLVPSYAFFQEGEIMDQATGKGKNESTIKKIAAFLPRLIMAIVDFIKKKFTKKEETPVVKYTKDSFEKLVKEVKEKGTDSPLVKGLIAAGAATVAIGAGGAIIVKIKRRNKDNDGNNDNDENVEDEIIINPPSEAGQTEQQEAPKQQEAIPSESTQNDEPKQQEAIPSESTQNDESKQQKAPKQQEKIQNASIRISARPWVEYTKLFTEFNNILRDKSQDIKANEDGIKDAFARLDKEWNRLKETKNIYYNSAEEADKALNGFTHTLDETGEILKVYANKIAEAINQSNGDNNKIAYLDGTFRRPLNALLNRLNNVKTSNTDFNKVVDQVNLTFTKLMQQGSEESNSPKSDNTTDSQVQNDPTQDKQS